MPRLTACGRRRRRSDGSVVFPTRKSSFVSRSEAPRSIGDRGGDVDQPTPLLKRNRPILREEAWHRRGDDQRCKASHGFWFLLLTSNSYFFVLATGASRVDRCGMMPSSYGSSRDSATLAARRASRQRVTHHRSKASRNPPAPSLVTNVLAIEQEHDRTGAQPPCWRRIANQSETEASTTGDRGATTAARAARW